MNHLGTLISSVCSSSGGVEVHIYGEGDEKPNITYLEEMERKKSCKSGYEPSSELHMAAICYLVYRDSLVKHLR